MHISTIDHFSRETASSFISLYQKYLSPHKGFSCAYRVLHRSESCSQYAKRMILEQGLSRAVPLVRQRFRDCRAANETLQTRRQRCQVRRLQSLSARLLLAPQSVSSLYAPILGSFAGSGFQTQPLNNRPLKTAWENQSWRAIESNENQEPETPADGQENGESGQPNQRQRRIFGGSFRKQKATPDNREGGYSDCGDCSDCGEWDNCAVSGCDALDCSGVDCSSAHCHSLDCNSMDCSHCNSLDCGTMDCSGADCSGADCSGCDVGSCG